MPNVVTTSAERVSKPTGAETPADALGVTKRMHSSDEDSNESDDARRCPTCGDTFASDHGVKVHRKLSHGEAVKPVLECDWCGNAFEVKPKREDTARFCSTKCHYAHKRGGKKPPEDLLHRLHWEEELPALKMSDVLGYPRQTIERWMDDYGIERRDQSAAEELKWEQMTAEERAHQVAEAHETTREAVKSGEWHLQTDNPERNGYGAGWTDEKKEKVRAMYDRACQGCGLSESESLESFGTKLDVHHIIPAGHFDDPERRNSVENLVPLCRSCHRKWEGIPIRPQLIG